MLEQERAEAPGLEQGMGEVLAPGRAPVTGLVMGLAPALRRRLPPGGVTGGPL
ncbi:MAG: hypothetical protein HYX91_06245 [Chloroflexi bacterium]|nr:hypothetical protein [Chloroflexota bacterium]